MEKQEMRLLMRDAALGLFVRKYYPFSVVTTAVYAASAYVAPPEMVVDHKQLLGFFVLTPTIAFVAALGVACYRSRDGHQVPPGRQSLRKTSVRPTRDLSP